MRPTTPPFDTVRVILRGVLRKPVIIVTATMIGMMIIYQAVTGSILTFLVDRIGLDQGTTAAILGIFFASTIVL